MTANLPDSDENTRQTEPSWLLPTKIAVVVMGLMILGGFGVIAYTIATRLNGADGQSAAASASLLAAPSATRQVATEFGTINVAIPHGARLDAVQIDEGRMILRINLQKSEAQLMVYDLATGRELGVFNITREKQK